MTFTDRNGIIILIAGEMRSISPAIRIPINALAETTKCRHYRKLATRESLPKDTIVSLKIKSATREPRIMTAKRRHFA